MLDGLQRPWFGIPQEENEGHSFISKLEQCNYGSVTDATSAQNNFYNTDLYQDSHKLSKWQQTLRGQW